VLGFKSGVPGGQPLAYVNPAGEMRLRYDPLPNDQSGFAGTAVRLLCKVIDFHIRRRENRAICCRKCRCVAVQQPMGRSNPRIL
jgi:hypothetical protein